MNARFVWKTGNLELLSVVDYDPDQPRNDAAPRTLYVHRDVLNREDIEEWATAQGLTGLVPDLHVTIAFSRTPVDWMKAGEDGYGETLTVPPSGVRMLDLFGPDQDTLVLLFNSSVLSWRHEALRRDTGASWDWPEYQPHITLALEYPDDQLSRLEPYRGKIVLGPEIFEEVDPDR